MALDGGSEGSADGRVLDTIAEEADSQKSTTSSVPVVATLIETDLSTLVQEVTEGVALGYEFKGFSTPVITDGTGAASFMRSSISTIKTETITVILDVDRRLEGWNFLINPAAFKRIINNLVGNAFKYNREQGWIRIALTSENLPDNIRGCKRAKVRLTISDSGKGISREFLKTRLFTPFSQENPLSPGAGLGMCIVRQLVGMMEGNIDIKSRSNSGTIVTVEATLTHRKLLEDEISPHNEDDLELFKEKTRGKKVLLIGFNTYPQAPNLEPGQQAMNHLRESLENCCQQYFGLGLLDDRHPDLAADHLADFIIVNESTHETRTRLNRLSSKSEVLRRVPVIVLCNRSPVDGFSGQKLFPYKDAHYTFNFARKPCGPKKLARALLFCLDMAEKQRKAAASGEISARSPRSSVPRKIQLPSDDRAFRALGSPVTPLSNPFDDLFSSATTSRSSGRSSKETTPATTSAGITPKSIFWAIPQPVLTKIVPPKVQVVPTIKESEKKISILVVEDNHINMMLLTTYLKRNGYGYESAVDGLEALNKVKAKESDGGFDAILMDLRKFPSRFY